MANLVSPRYERSVLINEILKPAEERIIEFKGLNRRTTVEEGEMSDMLNLTSDSYPVLTQRKPRGTMALPTGVVRPIRIMSRFDKIALIATNSGGIGFYYNGVIVPEVDDLSESTRMVAINNRVCFFPEKTCIDITSEGVQEGTYRSLDASYSVTNLTVTLSNVDATFKLPNVDDPFKYDDAIDIHIESYTPSGGSATATSFDVSCIIEEVRELATPGADTIVLPRETFIEMTGEGVSSFSFTGTIKRHVPDLDHVVEWNNRLWGASSEDNTIYACKLGDPSNWHYYQGTSMDSYYAEQGTDGEWTGAALYSNHLIFFKEDSMCRVYGTSPSNYQITNTEAFGVEKGSRQSVVTINDTVFYKSKIGIMAYSGGIPYCISDKLNIEFKAVVAGTEKRKYYASVQKRSGGYELLVFDAEKGLWHKEDDTRFRSCATINNRLYYVQYNSDLLVCSEDLPCSDYTLVGKGGIGGSVGIINPASTTEDLQNMRWRAVFGPFDEYLEEHKIYSKLALRLIAKGECSAKVYIAIDNMQWEVEEYCTPIAMTVTNGSISDIENAYADENSDTYATVPDSNKANEKYIRLYFPSLDEIPGDAEIESVEAKLGARYNASYIAQTTACLCSSSGRRISSRNWQLFYPPNEKKTLNLNANDYTFTTSEFKSVDESTNGSYILIGDAGTSSQAMQHLIHYIYGASLKVRYKTKWMKVEDYEHVSTKGDFIPIIPRRCDRYWIMIEGKGPCEVKTLTRRVRQGSFGRL